MVIVKYKLVVYDIRNIKYGNKAKQGQHSTLLMVGNMQYTH